MDAKPSRASPLETKRPAAEFRTPPRRLIADRAASWGVTGGGIGIILSILFILVFILIEVWPLLGGADVAIGESGLDGVPARALVSDEYRTLVGALDGDGTLRVARVDDGSIVEQRSLLGGGPAEPAARALEILTSPGRQLLGLTTDRGELVAQPIVWEVSFEGDTRVISPVIEDPVIFELEPGGGTLGAAAMQLDEDGNGLAVAQRSDGTLAVVRRTVEENLLTEEIEESWERFRGAVAPRVTTFVLDGDARNLFGGTPSGDLLWWRLSGGRPGEPDVLPGDAAVTALTLLIGDRSLVVGRENGALEVWFPVRESGNEFRLTKIREFPAMDDAVTLLSPSLRDKGFVAHDHGGKLGLYYSTTERVLWRGSSPVDDARALFYTPKADGAFVAGRDGIAALDVDNPHPEVSWGGYFGKVWYEGYEEPAYVWQSTGGTDEFEPKLSLTPLMIGTLKGTIYSLILAIPLGVLGAMFTSQFMHPDLRRFVKPTVELMAALPSVVLGFLAGLWLAPRVEAILPALALMVIVLPAATLLGTLGWHQLPRAFRNRFPEGAEVLIYMALVAAGIALCLQLNAGVEAWVFDGDVREWLRETTGLPYDQRNAVVVGLAMGFAVIPIIFSIAEDAFSNVPRSLVSGSLALGANRWQTVSKIVLPTASPGIFSAVMIGFGRAVGETMIVLMATGNTPVLDWNPFNGFRTLSANIAVEIPEAPHGETLYRTLFLAALILFVFTFLLNTLAEVVRQRLRKRYAEL